MNALFISPQEDVSMMADDNSVLSQERKLFFAEHLQALCHNRDRCLGVLRDLEKQREAAEKELAKCEKDIVQFGDMIDDICMRHGIPQISIAWYRRPEIQINLEIIEIAFHCVIDGEMTQILSPQIKSDCPRDKDMYDKLMKFPGDPHAALSWLINGLNSSFWSKLRAFVESPDMVYPFTQFCYRGVIYDLERLDF